LESGAKPHPVFEEGEMPHKNTSGKEQCARKSGFSDLWPQHMSGKVFAFQLTALVLLVFVSGWLIHQRDVSEHESDLAIQDRIHTEMIAIAVGENIDTSEAPRLLRILETSARGHNFSGAGVLDEHGCIIAHTNTTLAGVTTDLLSSPTGSHTGVSEVLRQQLFGNDSGRMRLQPLLGRSGRIGTIAVLFPPHEELSFFSGSLMLLLPAGLLILAFIGLLSSTIKSAIKPTADFLNQLSLHLMSEGTEKLANTPGKWDDEIEAAVSRINALTEAKEKLVIENKVLNYDRKRRGLIIDHLPDGIVMLDHSDKVVYVNRTASEITGVPTGPVSETEYPVFPSGLNDAFQKAKRCGQAEYHSAHDNSERLFSVTRVAVTSPHSSEQIGHICLMRDVTAQQASQRAQGEFLSQITHELKAPLNTMVTYVEALADDDLLTQDERRLYSNTLNTEAMRMAKLIDNMLQLSRIELGNLSAKYNYVKSSNLIAGIADSVQSQATGRQQTLVVNVPDNLPPLFGDKDLLGVAISNLVSNALKYTPDGGTITISAAVEDTGICIEVIDTGIGIREQDRDTIFERFSRTDRDEVQAVAGTGLGLALVKEIIETHDGTITLESEVDKGTTFTLRLPVREANGRIDLAA
jgi:two-component system, OmpR family, sensor histidine kinase VicK